MSLSLVAWFALAKPANVNAFVRPQADSTKGIDSSSSVKYKPSRRPTFKQKDRHGDPYTDKESKNPFYKKPSNVKSKVVLDETGTFYKVDEKAGEVDYRSGTIMTFDDYKKYKQNQTSKNFWKSKSKEQDEKAPNSTRSLIPKIYLTPVFDRLFGGNYIDIKPNGSVLLDFGGQWQYTNNPAIPLRQQSQGGFRFDQQIQMNVVAKIGTKLKFTANQDTKSQFDFDNTIKLDYTSTEEDIIQKIEAGNVSMPINSGLITGAQNLFGVKTTMKFGRLTLTSVLANQRGKQDEMKIQGGAQARDFEIRADQYEDNRHYFLGHFFRNRYEQSLSTAPTINNGIKVTRVEVWVTNRNNTTDQLRNIVAFTDLGESERLTNTKTVNLKGRNVPDNNSNDLWERVYAAARDTTSGNSLRNVDNVTAILQGELGLQNGVDFEILRGARKLKDTEFRFHPQLGYITLNSPLNRDDVLSVSYEGSYLGQNPPFKTGELTEDYQRFSDRLVVFTRLMRPSTIKTTLPIWDLQMKNMYNLNAIGLSRDNFQFRLIYKDDITQIDNPSLHEGPSSVNGAPLLQVFGMDRLNMSNDPQPDGNFDYLDSPINNTTPTTPTLSTGNTDPFQQATSSVNSSGGANSYVNPGQGYGGQQSSMSTNVITGITIDPAYGRIIFPVLEPFGKTLKTTIGESGRYYTDPKTGATVDMYDKYVNENQYRQTKSDALLQANKNKFFLKGKYQSTVSDEIQLQGLNIPPGSVKILNNGIPLTEMSDYQVDYNLGKVKIMNQALLLPGNTLSVQYEKSDLFQVRSKSFMGVRADYILNKDVAFGSTVLYMNERPLITRVNIGDEPSNNLVLGLDGTYRSESRLITKIIDNIPFYSTKEKSSLSVQGEVAAIIPGTSSLVSNDGGTSYIDDFEGTEIPFNLGMQPSLNWKLSSTPKGLEGLGASADSLLAYNDFRAKLAWYTVDPLFYRGGSVGTPTNLTPDDMSNHYIRYVVPQNIFPGRNALQLQANEQLFDLAFFPSERGPYNYRSHQIAPSGQFQDPEKSWGGITRAITTDTDFDNANYQYLEFWLMNPFLTGENGKVLDGKLNKNNVTGGKLRFNLGSISEDVVKDGRQEFEQGLPRTIDRPQPQFLDRTPWGFVTTQQYLTNAFTNDEGARNAQDIGLDGLNNDLENQYHANFINRMRQVPGISQAAINAIISDPSSDNFQYYLGGDLDNQNAKVLQRYKSFNGMEGNSPNLSGSTSTYNPSSYTTPDNEDINQNNTLNDLDEYYEYELDLEPGNLKVGSNYIINSQQEVGQSGVTWYQFRIPLREATKKAIGGIDNFKSIRFVRTYLTQWKEPVVLRFAEMKLAANQWRAFTDYKALEAKGGGEPIEPNDQVFSISTVNVEQNGANTSGTSSPYVIAPGIVRDRDNTSTVNRQLNEQSLRLCVNGLSDQSSRAAFKNISNLNLINYQKLRMFVHAETVDAFTKDDDLSMFIRVGTDFTDNYYEVEIPLKFTDLTRTDAESVWRVENWLDVDLEALSDLKMRRNSAGVPQFIPFPEYGSYLKNQNKMFVRGNPDYSSVQTIMIGIRNPKDRNGIPHSACIWVNELRTTGFNTRAGYAATGKLNMKLADLGNLTATTRYTGAGYGGIEQKISQRLQESTLEYGIAANLSLEKLLPKRLGLRLPMFATYDRKNISPIFDPLNNDVKLDRAIESKPEENRDDYRKLVEDNTYRRSISFTNISKVKTKQGAKKHIYDIENFNFNISYSDVRRTNINMEYLQNNYKGGAAYGYSFKPINLEPFKKVKILNKGALKLIGDINFNFMPSSIAVRGDLDRTFTQTQYTSRIDSGKRYYDGILPTYEKRFLFNRNYALAWNFTKSLQFNYVASVSAIIDEPPGEINGDAVRPGFSKKDSVLKNLEQGGRIKNFNQQFSLNYKIPLDKIPMINWVQADARYSGGYMWNAGSLGISDTLGNNAQNSREQSLNARLDMLKLYNKSKFLQKINNPVPKPPKKKDTKISPLKAKNIKADTSKKPKADTVKKPKDYMAFKYAMRAIMSLRSVNGTYSLQEGTTLPGYLDKPKYLGLSEGANGGLDASFLPFVLGSQNMDVFKNQTFAGENMSRAKLLSNYVTQSMSENVTLRGTVEPFKDFRIQLDAKMTNSSTYQELFKYDTAKGDPQQKFRSLSPIRSGSYSVSYNTIATSFSSSSGPDNISQVFKTFEDNRYIMQTRLSQMNPSVINDGARYDTNSQDVLIPAFLAAYSGQDAHKSGVDAFPRIPLPNWRVDYAGLGNLPAMKKYFSSFNLSHSYTSTYTVGGYTSSLKYGVAEIGGNNTLFNQVQNPESKLPYIKDSTGNLVPINIVNGVSILERFSPLLGINFRTKNNISIRIEYRRERNITLNIANSQVTEISSNDITIGVGYTKANLKLPFKSRGRDVILKNDITFRIDVTQRETETVQRKIKGLQTPTAGQTNFQIRPNVSYQASQRLNMQFYFDYNINVPKVSNSFTRSVTSFGLQLRYSLS